MDEATKEAIRDTANAGANKKVGFGKEFPMDIFDLKKPAKRRQAQLLQVCQALQMQSALVRQHQKQQGRRGFNRTWIFSW